MKTINPSWFYIEGSCKIIREKMISDNYKPDVIIGLLRGGVIPARIFADYFSILLDFFAIDVKLYEGIGVRKENATIKPFHFDIEEDKKILVVDDIWDSGKTMEAIMGTLNGRNVKTTTLFWRKSAKKKPDYYADEIEDEWVIFPWEKFEFSKNK